MAPQINGILIPATMVNRGKYRFTPRPIARRNGQGVGVVAGTAAITWTFKLLNPADWDWWTLTILQGNMSILHTNNRFINAQRVELPYNSCVVNYPTYEAISAGRYVGVTVEITQIIQEVVF